MTDSIGIRVRGARTHNLQNVDVELPEGRMTVITGLSGSGKSSLARDTIFAEGQRRYLESVSVHTHQMIRSLPRPEVDEISGLPPTISIDQRVGLVARRSSLTTITDLADYLRLLYARCGVVHCPACDLPVHSQTLDEIQQEIHSWPERTKFMVLAPLVRQQTGAHQQVLERVARNGLVRVRIDGELWDLSEAPRLQEDQSHTIEAVVDRLILKPGVESRLHESLALAVRESGNACLVCRQVEGQWQEHRFHTRNCCAGCDRTFPDPDPGLFSFFSARAACEHCSGFGVQGAVEQDAEDDEQIVFRKRLCGVCQGSRLQPLASAVRFGGQTLREFSALTVGEAVRQADQWNAQVQAAAGARPTDLQMRPEGQAAAARLLPDLLRQLRSLERIGLGYLTLDRSAGTLSGGEYQRARLACCLSTESHGACFLLDEPTSGLHPENTARLLQLLSELQQSGATLVVVEHDSDVMRAADQLVELGPGAGTDGGRLVYAGPPQHISANTATGRLLQQNAPKVQAGRRGVDDSTPRLVIRQAEVNNLQQVTVSVPLQRLVGISGVSGSGKSSLVNETLLPVVRAALDSSRSLQATLADVQCQAVEGLEQLQRLVPVDGRPVSRNRRSCLATHSGVWNDIRRLFARTREARSRGLTAAQFSFNSGRGRCGECRGTGVQEIRMSLLPDTEIPCSVCQGRRFTQEILDVRFGGRTVSDVLHLSVREALEAFAAIASSVRRLTPFEQVGLGYLTLGQPASTWSGGEAQRVRLASELMESQEEHALYLLDEPTRGLHGADVERLLAVLQGLVEKGHSVLVIEHNTQVLRSCDWLIDMGPGAAEEGGTVVAAGSPDELKNHPTSMTGRWL